ncbi:MAG: hypothetical protein P1V51_06260 [Deltaproteobacteria bacterium]|nr:hypothetical protein [Deltaproteobacteria bacterium]
MSDKRTSFSELARAATEGRDAEPGALSRRSRLGLVPADYAEKTMSSLLSLHEDLMAEKERALDITRRLMAAEQDRAELESYVRLLEVELHRRGGPAVGTLRVGGGGGLSAATETVLRSLARPGPAAPEAPPAAPASEAPAAPAPAVDLAPAAPAAPAVAAVAEAPVRAPTAPEPVAPRPPRPSASYRAPVATASGDAPATRDREAQEREQPRPRAVGEGWRQW